jgi:hypothetical protein
MGAPHQEVDVKIEEVLVKQNVGSTILLGLGASLLAGYFLFGILSFSDGSMMRPRESNVAASLLQGIRAAIVDQRASQEARTGTYRTLEAAVVPKEIDAGIVYGNPENTTACARLTQADFDRADQENQNVTLDFNSGCYEIVGDSENNVYFDHTLIVRGGTGTAYVTCNSDTIRPRENLPGIPDSDAGIILMGSSRVQDCRIKYKTPGFELRSGGDPIADHVTAERSGQDGFTISAGTVSNAMAKWNDRGYYLEGGVVQNATAEDNTTGFMSYWGGSIAESYANRNDDGFVIGGSGSLNNTQATDNQTGYVVYGGTVTGNTARENVVGFHLSAIGGTMVTGNTAVANFGGFSIDASQGTIVQNQALQNTLYGFDVSGSSTVQGATADANQYGFLVHSGARVSSSSAASNRYDGFWADGGTIDLSSTATSNGSGSSGSYGFRLLNDATAQNVNSNQNRNGVYVGSSYPLKARLINGVRICSNTGNDIFVNGGIVSGTFYVSKPIQGAGNWQNATFLSCAGGGEDADDDGGGRGSSPAVLKRPGRTP